MNTAILEWRCRACQQVFPRTNEYFSRSKCNKDGFHSYCKKCRVVKAQQYYFDHKDQVREYGKLYRQTRQAEIKVRDRLYYSQNKDRWRKYREVNRSRINENKMRNYYRRRDEMLQRNHQKYAAHRDEIIAKKRTWRRMHREEVNARKRLWGKSHHIQVNAASQRRRARKRDYPQTFTIQNHVYAWKCFYGCCAYCGNPPSLFDKNTVLHEEHFIPLAPDYELNAPNPGYAPDNIVPACQSCNLSKNNSNPTKWVLERFGKRKGAKILARISAFFESIEPKGKKDE